MIKCEKIKIKDFAEVITGGTPSTKNKDYWNGNIPWLPSGVCQDCIVDSADTYITELGLKESSAKMMPRDTVLIALTGATTGKTGILKFEACANQSVTGILPNERYIPNYLFYYLISIRDRILYDSYGGAQKHISQGYVKEIEVPLPNIEKQKKIVKKLDNVKKIIDIRKAQIQQLDRLIKSQFIEMFEGKKYNKKCLNDISIIKGEYGSGASAGEYIKGQPRYVRITDIQEDGRLNNNSMASPKNENNLEKYTLNYGDVLFARTGATVGKTYKYSKDDGYCIYAGYCIRFRLDLEKVNPDYIFTFTKTEEYKKWVANKQRVVAQPNINAKEYGNDLLIPIPPIELQNKFAEFVKLIDKQKAEIQKSLGEMEKLQESLMNKYFG